MRRQGTLTSQPNSELTCKDLVELVTDYFEDALPPVQKQRFEDHLKGCKGCTAYLNQMRKTINLIGKLTEDDVQPAAKDELLHVFRNWRATPKE